MFFEKKELSLEEVIEQEVIERKANGIKYSEYDLAAKVAPFMLLVNLPLGVIFTLGSLILSSYDKKEKLDNVLMPDSWLKKVAESSKISATGLNFLAIKLQKNGSITVSDAIRFLETEEQARQHEIQHIANLQIQEDKFKNLQFEGALSILEKANIHFDGLYTSTIDTFKKSSN